MEGPYDHSGTPWSECYLRTTLSGSGENSDHTNDMADTLLLLLIRPFELQPLPSITPIMSPHYCSKYPDPLIRASGAQWRPQGKSPSHTTYHRYHSNLTNEFYSERFNILTGPYPNGWTRYYSLRLCFIGLILQGYGITETTEYNPTNKFLAFTW